MKNYSRPCRSNRVVFNLPDSEESMTQLASKLLKMHVGKYLSFAVIARDGNGNIQGLIHCPSSFLPPREGGARKWNNLIPALSKATLQDAGRETDEDYKWRIQNEKMSIVEEFGTPAVSGHSLRQQHIMDILSSKNVEEALQKDADYVVRNHHAVNTMITNKKWKENKGIVVEKLNFWQEMVFKKLTEQDGRKILFVIDSNGNRGKTYLGLYLKQKFGNSHATLTCSMKERDAAHILSQEPNLESVAFDYSRQCQPETFAWGLFEQLKDGVISSGKYQSQTVYFKNFVKVVVFTNHDPVYEFHKLSRDRIDIVNLDHMYTIDGNSMLELKKKEDEEE